MCKVCLLLRSAFLFLSLGCLNVKAWDVLGYGVFRALFFRVQVLQGLGFSGIGRVWRVVGLRMFFLLFFVEGGG